MWHWAGSDQRGRHMRHGSAESVGATTRSRGVGVAATKAGTGRTVARCQGWREVCEGGKRQRRHPRQRSMRRLDPVVDGLDPVATEAGMA
jgi:hypothetical protein